MIAPTVDRVKSVALASAMAARGLDEDEPTLLDALSDAGLDPAVAAWDDPDVDWSRFDLVVLRSTWDYHFRLAAFLAWAADVARHTRLANSLATVTWNTDKRYLAELAAAGVPTVPTAFLKPAERDGGLDAALGAYDEVVVKPAVSAGSVDTARHRLDAAEGRDAARDHVRRLLADGRVAMVQPYIPSVDERGERALVHIDGRFSHAITKGPILGPHTTVVGDLFAAEDISTASPTAAELAVGAAAMAVAPGGPLLYARVDVVDGADGPMVLELEATEPSLFLLHHPEAAARLAGAIRRAAEG